MKYIMILEDDIDLATGIEISLKSEDLQFICCHTIQEANDKLNEQIFDLLILDINLPDGSGRLNDMLSTEKQIKVLGSGIGLILAVLSILNYANMMAAGV